MADSDKALWQAVEQKSSDKLHGADGNRLGAIFLSVFGSKGYPAVFEQLDATVCNGHPVGVACQLFKDMFGTFYGIAHSDDPVFGIQLVFKLLVVIREFVFYVRADVVHLVDELAAKH